MTEEYKECSDCEGSGEVHTMAPSECTEPIDVCCGGCFGEEECETCNGTGEIEKEDD